MLRVTIVGDNLAFAGIREDLHVEHGDRVCGIDRTVAQAVALGRRHLPDVAITDRRLADSGTYAVSLCRSLAEIQGVPTSAVTLTCNSTQVMLDLDAVTALGIVLAELVTNSHDHAFPGGTGSRWADPDPFPR